MEQKTYGFYTSAPLGNNDLEQRFEKKLTDVNSFIYHIKNNNEMITYFQDKIYNSKKKC